MNLVYVLFRVVYGKPREYYGVFSTPDSAHEQRLKLEREEENVFGYHRDYVVQPTRLDSGE